MHVVVSSAGIMMTAAHEGEADHMSTSTTDAPALQDVAQPFPHGLHRDSKGEVQVPHEELHLQNGEIV